MFKCHLGCVGSSYHHSDFCCKIIIRKILFFSHFKNGFLSPVQSYQLSLLQIYQQSHRPTKVWCGSMKEQHALFGGWGSWGGHMQNHHSSKTTDEKYTTCTTWNPFVLINRLINEEILLFPWTLRAQCYSQSDSVSWELEICKRAYGFAEK